MWRATAADDARLFNDWLPPTYAVTMGLLWITAMVSYAEAAIECREPRYAAPLFNQLAPWADQLSTTGTTVAGPVSHVLGGLATVLGRPDEAEAYFARSAACQQADRCHVLRRPHRPPLGADAG